MQYNKYETTSVLLSETRTPEKEHEIAQKQREKDWATRVKGPATLAGAAGGAYGGAKFAKYMWNRPGLSTPGGYKLTSGALFSKPVGIAGAVAAPIAGALAGRMIGKRIAIMVARMTRQGYTKPQIDQAVNNLKRQQAS